VIALLAVCGALAVGEYLAAAVISVMLASGRALEGWAAGRARRDLRALLERVPRTARRYRAAGLETVQLGAVAPGDRLLVASGDLVPVDGTVAGGPAVLDESALTGEPLPVERPAGEQIRSGTVNAGGPFDLFATATAADSTYAGIVRLVSEAEQSQAPFVRLADRYALWFLLVSLAAAGVAWAVAGAERAVAVLVVATPCPLILAAPVALVSGLSIAARRGVIVKGGGVLERLAGCTTLLLDKTGTLTSGQLAVARVIAATRSSEDELVATAAATVGASSHPVAAAIRAEAARRGLGGVQDEGAERRELPGLGVETGDTCCGSAAFLRSHGVEVDSPLRSAVKSEAEQGASIVYVASGARALGALALADPPRADAAAAVARLRRMGLSLALVSGDHAAAVRCAAGAAGIGEAASGVSPAGKVERVRAERANGARVAFAGDGINDAAALAAADLGFAFAHGSDVTLLAADVVSHDARLDSLPSALALARAALRRIRENLVLAIAYNAVAVPLAIAGILGPFSAALAMSASSLLVTGNALRLRREGKRQ
jgi:heavy metal translocating P-type ATPase